MTKLSDSSSHIIDDSNKLVALSATYPQFIADNLENIFIQNPTSLHWPSDIKAKLADTIVFGRLKYTDLDTWDYRVADLRTLTTGIPCLWKPLQFNPDSRRQVQTSIFCEATRSALDVALEQNLFRAPISRLHEIRTAALHSTYVYNRELPSELGEVAFVIRDVFMHSSQSIQQLIDMLFTSITGFPCVFDAALIEAETYFPLFNNYEDKVSFWMNQFLAQLAIQMTLITLTRNAKPCLRWKSCLMLKMGYVERLRKEQGSILVNWDVIKLISKLDESHVAIETGVALKVSAHKICYVGPATLSNAVMSAIADVYITQDAMDLAYKTELSPSSGRFLVEEDVNILVESENTDEFGKWLSYGSCSFTVATLRDLICRGGMSQERVATNRFGDCLFFVIEFGPWSNDVLYLNSTNGASMKSLLLEQTVHGYPGSCRWKRLRERTRQKHVEKGGEKAMHIYGHEAFEYKPVCLQWMVNKPGRILVKRRGLRGNAGRLFVIVVLIFGVLSMAMNWGKRETMLERVLDATQVISLVAGLYVVVAYLATKTLRSSLDLLAGWTEVEDEAQMTRLMGVSIEEVKIATTYESGSMFWLSEKNSSFCAGMRLGNMVFSEGLDMLHESPHVRHGCVVDHGRGFWILQGWSFRIEERENASRMTQVAHADRVYVRDGHQPLVIN